MISRIFVPKFDDCLECKNLASRKCKKCTNGEYFEEEDSTEAVDEVNPFELLRNLSDFDDE